MQFDPNRDHPLTEIVAGSHVMPIVWRGVTWDQHAFCTFYSIWQQLYTGGSWNETVHH